MSITILLPIPTQINSIIRHVNDVSSRATSLIIAAIARSSLAIYSSDITASTVNFSKRIISRAAHGIQYAFKNEFIRFTIITTVVYVIGIALLVKYPTLGPIVGPIMIIAPLVWVAVDISYDILKRRNEAAARAAARAADLEDAETWVWDADYAAKNAKEQYKKEKNDAQNFRYAEPEYLTKLQNLLNDLRSQKKSIAYRALHAKNYYDEAKASTNNVVLDLDLKMCKYCFKTAFDGLNDFFKKQNEIDKLSEEYISDKPIEWQSYLSQI